MPKPTNKRAAKPKASAKLKPGEAFDDNPANGNGATEEGSGAATATMELEPPTRAVETAPAEDPKPAAPTGGSKRDTIAASLNIAKLQAMTMTQLNSMAKEL